VLIRSAALAAVSSEVEAAASQDSVVVIAGGRSVEEAKKKSNARWLQPHCHRWGRANWCSRVTGRSSPAAGKDTGQTGQETETVGGGRSESFAAEPSVPTRAAVTPTVQTPPVRVARAEFNAGCYDSTDGMSRVGRPASISARFSSSDGGRTSDVPSSSRSSSTANPGPSVASSKRTPPGSRK